jgi:hypothetical protein
LVDSDERVEFGELFRAPQYLDVRLYRITPEAAGRRA